jgi:hypothetical protein
MICKLGRVSCVNCCVECQFTKTDTPHIETGAAKQLRAKCGCSMHCHHHSKVLNVTRRRQWACAAGARRLRAPAAVPQEGHAGPWAHHTLLVDGTNVWHFARASAGSLWCQGQHRSQPSLPSSFVAWVNALKQMAQAQQVNNSL